MRLLYASIAALAWSCAQPSALIYPEKALRVTDASTTLNGGSILSFESLFRADEDDVVGIDFWCDE